MKLYAILVLSFIQSLALAAWNYEESSDVGPEHWDSVNPACGSTSQSPIDIATATAAKDSKLTKFEFLNYKKSFSNFELINNGHTAQVNTKTDQIRVKGGGLVGEYVLEQFHFHWGETNKDGSEHLVNGESYPCEVHLVHRSAQYPDVKTALGYNGVAVLGIFIKVTNLNDASSAFSRLTSAFRRVPFEGNTTTLSEFEVSSLLPVSGSYYRYSGSLTTPPCTEGITWTVFNEPIKITAGQLEQFRNLHAESIDESIATNHRPPQPLNGRIITKYV